MKNREVRHSEAHSGFQAPILNLDANARLGSLYQKYGRKLAFFYDPTLGRFIAKDPFAGVLLRPQSLNRFTYVLNEPTKATDPSGFAPDNTPSEFVGLPTFLPTLTGVGTFANSLSTIPLVPAAPGISRQPRTSNQATTTCLVELQTPPIADLILDIFGIFEAGSGLLRADL